MTNEIAEFIKTQTAINETVMNSLILAHDELAHLKDAHAQLIDQLNLNSELQNEEENEPSIN